MIPEHFSYVEVFGGAGALLLNKPPSMIEVYNDLYGELVNLFEVVRDNVEDFLERSQFLLYSRELTQRWKADLAMGRMPEDPVERAVRFWYIIRSSFAAHPGKGWAFGRETTRNRGGCLQNARDSIRLIHDRLRNVEIDHLDFRRCFELRDSESAFLYVDPPYLGAEEYATGPFTLADHEDLAAILHDAKGKWILTIGDHPKIRRLYAGFPKSRVTSPLAVAKVIRRKRTRFAQLIIRNFEPPKHPIYAAVASEAPLMDLFGLDIPA
jgi:DNA adenine methylase